MDVGASADNSLFFVSSTRPREAIPLDKLKSLFSEKASQKNVNTTATRHNHTVSTMSDERWHSVSLVFGSSSMMIAYWPNDITSDLMKASIDKSRWENCLENAKRIQSSKKNDKSNAQFSTDSARNKMMLIQRYGDLCIGSYGTQYLTVGNRKQEIITNNPNKPYKIKDHVFPHNEAHIIASGADIIGVMIPKYIFSSSDNSSMDTHEYALCLSCFDTLTHVNKMKNNSITTSVIGEFVNIEIEKFNFCCEKIQSLQQKCCDLEKNLERYVNFSQEKISFGSQLRKKRKWFHDEDMSAYHSENEEDEDSLQLEEAFQRKKLKYPDFDDCSSENKKIYLRKHIKKIKMDKECCEREKQEMLTKYGDEQDCIDCKKIYKNICIQLNKKAKFVTYDSNLGNLKFYSESEYKDIKDTLKRRLKLYHEEIQLQEMSDQDYHVIQQIFLRELLMNGVSTETLSAFGLDFENMFLSEDYAPFTSYSGIKSTILHCAARCDTPQYCKIITEELSKRITQGVNDYEKKYLLTLVQDIIEYRILSNELNNTPLMIAVQYGRKENAKILLQFSRAIELTVNFEELLSLAGISGQNEMLNFLYSECSESQSYILQRSSEIHPFHRAASLGYINTVKWYIDKGYPVNSTDSLGCGAPIYAACNGNGKMLDFFMQEDCDPWLPVVSSNPAFFPLLCRHGFTPIHAAISCGHDNTAYKLLQAHGGWSNLFDKNECVLPGAPCHSGVIELEDHCSSKPASHTCRSYMIFTLMTMALMHGRVGFVQKICEDMSVDIRREACRWKNVIFNEIDANNIAIGAFDFLGLVVFSGHVASLRFLSKRNIDMNMPNLNGVRPIHIASRFGYTAIIQFLVKRKADLNAVTNNGETAQDLAEANEQYAVVNILCELKKVVNES